MTDPTILAILLGLVGVVGILGIVFAVILLRSTSKDRRVYRASAQAENGRRLMTIQTAQRRYSVSLVIFLMALLIYTTSLLLPLGVLRSSINAFAFLTALLLQLLNIALDAKDDRDLIAYGMRRDRRADDEQAKRDAERDEQRDAGRDAGRDEIRDPARDLARDAEKEGSA